MPQRIRYTDREEDWRDAVCRDYDVVLYSSAWRRLRGVTQVSPVTDGLSRTHDRMIHSLKVAQVGKRLGQYLAYRYPGPESSRLNPDAIEVAGMAHDLGHPPFGHVGEKELQHILGKQDYRWRLTDSFEGNAQTFRVLTRLSQKSNNAGTSPSAGMNLTFESLAACTKYPWGFGKAASVLGNAYAERPDYYDKKWGFYNSEAIIWEEVKLHALEDGSPYSPNAQIMDIADDITYAVHDVHDYFRMGLIPLHEIGVGIEGQPNQEYRTFDQYASSALATYQDTDPEALMEAKRWLQGLPYPVTTFNDTTRDREMLHGWESSTVRRIQAEVSLAGGSPSIPEHIRVAIEYLKELTWYYVINRPSLSASQQGQRRIIGDLHEWLCMWAAESYAKDGDKHQKAKTRRNLRRIPSRFRDLIGPTMGGEDESISRAAVDFITGLTDAEAVNLHQHLGGTGFNVTVASWL